jgi:glycosyltransferase involved in cell wall biosynthesis
MLAYAFYENDSRIKQYAEALAGRGDQVDVIALRREGQSDEGNYYGIQVYRIQKRITNEKGKISYLMRIVRFFLKSAFFLARRHLKVRYDVIHVHSVPDFEVFAALIPKLMGAKIILDIHDIVPEFYASKFNVSNNSVIYKALVHVERASAAFSDHIIVANHLWYDVITSRSVINSKCSVFLNYPDPNIFHGDIPKKKDGKFIILYPGTLNWHQGLDIAVKAFARIADRIQNTELHIIGEGPSRTMLNLLIAELGLGNRVFIKDFVPHDEIGHIMANADLGIVPKRANSFGNEAFSTKILEFMALGVPVIVSDTKIDEYYFDNSLVQFFRAGNEEDLARSMLEMIRDDEKRARFVKSAFMFVQKNTWVIKKQEYLDLVDSLAQADGNTTN